MYSVFVCVFFQPRGEKWWNNLRDILHTWYTSIQGKVLKCFILALPEIHFSATVLSILQRNLSPCKKKKKNSSISSHWWSFAEQMVPAPVRSTFRFFIWFLLTFCHGGPAAHESRRPRRHRDASTSCRRRVSTWHGRHRRWLPRPCMFHANRSNFGDAPRLQLRHSAELFWAQKEEIKKSASIKPRPSGAITFNRHFRSHKSDVPSLVFDVRRFFTVAPIAIIQLTN